MQQPSLISLFEGLFGFAMVTLAIQKIEIPPDLTDHAGIHAVLYDPFDDAAFVATTERWKHFVLFLCIYVCRSLVYWSTYVL